MSDLSLSPPRRGRRPQTEADIERMREHLVSATGQVFSRVGYHGLSVELVIAEAGVSRPTFYKYFRATEEPVELLIQQVNQDLIQRLLQAMSQADSPLAKVEAALLAWRAWLKAIAPMLRPFFAELNDAHSPVARHRQQTLDALSAGIGDVVAMMGRQRPSDLAVRTFLNSIEFIGYRHQLDSPDDEAAWQQARDLMFRLALALLGESADWKTADVMAREWQAGVMHAGQ